MEAIKLCRLDTPIIFIEARINLSRFVVTGCAAKTSATVTFPSLNLISLFAFCFNISRDYLAAAFPELNAWERAGADASSAGMVDAGFENQKELTKMQLDNQKEIAEMQNETQKEIAGIQSATSRQNTKDQVYAQNEMLAYQQKESTARVASI